MCQVEFFLQNGLKIGKKITHRYHHSYKNKIIRKKRNKLTPNIKGSTKIFNPHRVFPPCLFFYYSFFFCYNTQCSGAFTISLTPIGFLKTKHNHFGYTPSSLNDHAVPVHVSAGVHVNMAWHGYGIGMNSVRFCFFFFFCSVVCCGCGWFQFSLTRWHSSGLGYYYVFFLDASHVASKRWLTDTSLFFV